MAFFLVVEDEETIKKRIATLRTKLTHEQQHKQALPLKRRFRDWRNGGAHSDDRRVLGAEELRLT